MKLKRVIGVLDRCVEVGDCWEWTGPRSPTGYGTTAEAAQAVGGHAILIDLDERNAELARQRCGMFLEIVA